MSLGHLSGDIEVREEHLGLMLAGAVRYALGRKSSAVSDTIDMVHAYWPALSNRWRDVIRRDVREAIALAERQDVLVGMQCDHDAWSELVDWFGVQTDLEMQSR